MSKFDSILLNSCFIKVTVFFNVRNEASYNNCLGRHGFLYYPESVSDGKDVIVVPDNEEERKDIKRLLADFTRCGIDFVTEGF
jgi:hypothetical protein